MIGVEPNHGDGMSVPAGAESVLHRVRRKTMVLVPILGTAAVLVAVLAGLTTLVTPYLPDTYQVLLAQVQRGDWAGSRDRFAQLLGGYGAAQPVAFLAIQVAQVLLAPIPGQVMGLLGGYLFGFWHGLLLSMAGLAIGSGLAISIGRVLGQQLVRNVVPAPILAKFDYLIDRGGLWTFFVIFLLPGFPDDVVCLIAGLTRLSIWKLVGVCVLGRLPGMAVLSFVGANVGGNLLLANIVLATGMGVACVLWLWSEEVEAHVRRLSHAR